MHSVSDRFCPAQATPDQVSSTAERARAAAAAAVDSVGGLRQLTPSERPGGGGRCLREIHFSSRDENYVYCLEIVENESVGYDCIVKCGATADFTNCKEIHKLSLPTTGAAYNFARQVRLQSLWMIPTAAVS